MKNENKYAAPALDKGLDILEYLSSIGSPQSQAEVADALGRTPAEIFRMLARLEYRGYIIRDPMSGKYHLSLKLYHLSHTHSPVESLRRASLPAMQDLANKSGHSVHLSVLDQGALLVVAQAKSPSPVSLSIAEGSRFPLSTTTSGMLLLANMGYLEREDFLSLDEAYLGWSKKRQKDYRQKLDTIQQSGHACADSEITQGVTDIAAPIGKEGGSLLASLAISTVSSIVGTKRLSTEELIKAAVETADRISEANGI
ncbi:IclR family transcriptional regulator [Pelagicoccus mobilis]|uniref:IclR family transcriptional regulator n=1 Tax=Pelagicoccus mobilis TaxID=415221 RepID=A0A934VPS6_9BACT|nr:IclR family transcriptional regulator [Pelagicoccus mobilis]MBK1875824.1 IclR family transcriptional regulator [Pelagicoccus mobilis]